MKSFKGFSMTSRGAVHIKNGTICQDVSGVVNNSDHIITAVCDGHGGTDYFRSHIGAYFAKEAVFNCMSDSELFSYCKNADTKKHQDEIMIQLEKCIISEWNNSILNHYLQNPFTEAELSAISESSRKAYEKGYFIEQAYGTTLITSVITEDYWFCLHIGDGKCIAITDSQQCIQPVPWDERCYLNNTTSMCDMNAIGCFRHFFSRELPNAVFIACDGVDNSFTDNEAMNNFYKLITTSFCTMPFDNAVNELAEYLPVLSEKGSGDDISIAGIINTDIYFY